MDISVQRICYHATNLPIVIRKQHSTETALIRMLSDALAAADRQRVTLLGLLDLSAAFDCVDHTLLLQRLHISMV